MLEREPTEADRTQTMTVARSRLVGFERYRAVAARTCFYSVAEDERFIVEPVGRALVLAGFSGHGFKFGAVMGEAVARGAERRAPAEALQAWAAGNA